MVATLMSLLPPSWYHRTMSSEVTYVVGYRTSDRATVKIGCTKNLRTRLVTLRTYSPVPLHLMAWAPGGVELESALHTEFAQDRLEGEWFDLSQTQLASLTRRLDNLAEGADDPLTSSSARKAVSLRLPVDLWARIEVAAAEADMSMNRWICGAIKEEVARLKMQEGATADGAPLLSESVRPRHQPPDYQRAAGEIDLFGKPDPAMPAPSATPRVRPVKTEAEPRFKKGKKP